MKAGDEIRGLARFSSTQRTAFRKLLKKFKKWTGSVNLEERFREEVLGDPKSFTKLDLGPLLDEYSDTLQRIRSLYETNIGQKKLPKPSKDVSTTSESNWLQTAVSSGSRARFDTAISTVPLGEAGEIANYFVHLESVVELQILLLQRMEYFTPRSRSNSTAIAVSRADSAQALTRPTSDADYFMLVADDLDRFAHEQSALTVEEREHVAGFPPQKARIFVRWNHSENALVSRRRGRANIQSIEMKRKRIDALFETRSSHEKSSEVSFDNDDREFKAFQAEVKNDMAVQPLFQISTARSRFAGIGNGPDSLSLATLDTSISIRKAGKNGEEEAASNFPFAVLQVREEGNAAEGIVSFLDHSHLVERIRGFSLEYHALWELYKPNNIAPPFWMPILSRDIRKLPPLALGRTGSVGGSGSESQAGTRHSVSTPSSALGITDTTTAVETDRPSPNPLPDLPETALKWTKNQRRRTSTRKAERQQQRYWNEYDDPEDGDGGEGYFLYIDPDEKSTLDRLLDKITGLWGKSVPEQEPLLGSPATPDNGESSDEEQGTSSSRFYGTVLRNSRSTDITGRTPNGHRPQLIPPLTSICLVASVAILIVAYFLQTTSRHKYATKVDAGVIFAIVCSIAFAVIGFGPLLSRQHGPWTAIVVAAVVLVLDVVFSGYLLASMLG